MRLKHTDRRGALKALGATALFGGGLSGSVAAHDPDEGGSADATSGRIRLFSEVAVDGALEAVTQDRYVYVATGSGMAVVDWRNPNRPTVVARIDASDPAAGILDVKVEGDLAALASNGASGITLVDVSDPSDPREITYYEAGHGVHNCFLQDGYAYLTINESRETPFDAARTDVVDVSDPADPTKVGEYRLEREFPEFADSGVCPCHDIYVQGDRLYQAFWDAGVVVADVSDPTSPTTVTQFGAAPGADEPYGESFPLQRYLTRPGNAHYVQPSPDGDLVFVGAETFPGSFVDHPDNDDYGGIKVWDVSTPERPEKLTRIAPPPVDAFRTSHNFDVTANRLHASWYNGGVTTHDVTDPSNPEQIGHYATPDTSFWTAVADRSFTVGSDIGGGLVFLHSDRGERRGPEFEGGDRPTDPGMDRPSE